MIESNAIEWWSNGDTIRITSRELNETVAIIQINTKAVGKLLGFVPKEELTNPNIEELLDTLQGLIEDHTSAMVKKAKAIIAKTKGE